MIPFWEKKTKEKQNTATIMIYVVEKGCSWNFLKLVETKKLK